MTSVSRLLKAAAMSSNALASWIVMIAVMAMPALVLSLQGSANVCLIFLLLCSGVYLFSSNRRGVHREDFRRLWPVHWAMASMFLIILVGQILRGTVVGRVMDTPLRLAFFAPVFWLLLSQSAVQLQRVQWGYVAGALLVLAKLILMMPTAESRIPIVSFTNAIPFGDIALLLGTWSFLSLGWSRHGQWLLNGVRIAGGVAGVATSILSQSRGGWIAIPVFAALVIWSLTDKVRSLRIRFAISAVCVIVAATVVMTSHTIPIRFKDAQTDIEKFYSAGDENTSVGIRLQLWRGAWVIFKEHPLRGIGRENFSSALHELAVRKVISNDAAQFSHTHDEVMFNLSTLGIFGLVSILSIYFFPAIVFARYLKKYRDQQIRTGATMGLALCIGFVIFGLTETMFVVSMTTSFYALSLATFLAFVVSRRRELAASESEHINLI